MSDVSGFSIISEDEMIADQMLHERLVAHPEKSIFEPIPVVPVIMRRFVAKASKYLTKKQELLPGLAEFQIQMKAKDFKSDKGPLKATPAADIWRESAEVKKPVKYPTAEEIIKYLYTGRHSFEPSKPVDIIKAVRAHPKVGFLYLSHAEPETSINYDPYSFKISTYEEIDFNNFLTVSPYGVIEVYGGENEYTPLTRWEQDFKVYKKLVKRESYINFRKWKAFKTWHKVIRMEIFIIRRAMVCDKLMYGNK